MPKFGQVMKDLTLNPKSSFVIVSYWWGRNNINKNSVRNRTYDQQAKELVESCIKHKCNYYIVEIPEFAKSGQYQIAIGYKAEFIQHALDVVTPLKAIYIDTDMLIRKYPALLDVDADYFGINYMDMDEDCYVPYEAWVPGGIMGFSNDRFGRALCDTFVREMKTKKKLAEDKILSMILTETMAVIPLRCMWLPETYMFMFSQHKYEDGIGYVHRSTLAEEARHSNIRVSDVVIYHEDFETGDLDDVYAARIGNIDRFPKTFYKVIGHRLRCPAKPNMFKRYDLNLTTKTQLNQLSAYNKISAIPPVPKEQLEFTVKQIYRNDTDSHYTVVTIAKDLSEVDKLIRSCNKYNLSLRVYSTDKNVKLPMFLKKVIPRVKTDVLYAEPGYTFKSQPKLVNKAEGTDLMIYNDLEICNDPRIVRFPNMELIYIGHNHTMMKLLDLWIHELPRRANDTITTKTLEYVINKGLLVKNMRCIWLPKSYLNNKITTRNVYKTIPAKYSIYKEIEQCANRPPVDEGEPTVAHRRSPRRTPAGSRKSTKPDKLVKSVLLD